MLNLSTPSTKYAIYHRKSRSEIAFKCFFLSCRCIVLACEFALLLSLPVFLIVAMYYYKSAFAFFTFAQINLAVEIISINIFRRPDGEGRGEKRKKNAACGVIDWDNFNYSSAPVGVMNLFVWRLAYSLSKFT